ncbi:MAG TPA: ABC transporter ATP-binding protein, partial [Anaerolineales bacterium]|nr:ABC transporter ATP-binding protein [Anaerolineales bacterium]
LDEPLGALDLKLRKEMQLELKEIQERVGITFVYVTHDQEEAITMSDRIAVMDLGKILQIGDPEEIYERPANLFVAGFIGETNLISGKVRKMGESYGLEISDGQTLAAGWVEENVSIGEASVISVRPEKLQIYPSEKSHEFGNLSKITGIIEQVVYIGTDTRYLVRLTEKTIIQVRQQNMMRGGTRLKAGERVNLFWDSENARILKR